MSGVPSVTLMLHPGRTRKYLVQARVLLLCGTRRLSAAFRGDRIELLWQAGVDVYALYTTVGLN